MEKVLSTKGHNWGIANLTKDKLELNDKSGKDCHFTLNYADIQTSNAAKENEVQIELEEQKR